MRTDAEKKAFAEECQEIERNGGDVLAYIAENWPSYTPRATWYKLQLEYLKRKKYCLTEGRPEDQNEKGVRTRMGKMLDVANEALEVLSRGENVFEFLAAKGYKNPSSQWWQCKDIAKRNDPDLYEKLCAFTPERRPPQRTAEQAIPWVPKDNSPTQELKPGESLPVKIPEAVPKTVKFNGKEYEKLEPVKMTNVPFDPCIPGNQVRGKPDLESIEVYVEKPNQEKRKQQEEPDVYEEIGTAMKKAVDEAAMVRKTEKPPAEPLETLAIRSRIKGYYQIADVLKDSTDGERYVHLIWRDIVTGGERSLGLSVTDWLRLAKEIPAAMKQLGL